ncbi:Arc family DNA-binding protein [Neorhizobium lilium]|uniref:Arc family DNA-binding protein n=2 Tax=Neorhizobium lilium TaxID=2503024 RepID=A0A3S3VLG6_9HYPH|nr:Arc family DNA-binding protein [Neorhizobium lilium]
MASISEIGRGNQQINLRAPDGLHDRIKESALKNGRSLNAELVHRLESSFEPSVALAPAIAQVIDEHIEQQVNSRLRAIAAQIGGA